MARKDYPPNRLQTSINAIKTLIDDRLLEDPSSYFSIVEFSDKPKKVVEFTNIKNQLYEALDSLRLSGKSALGEALALSIKIIIAELRKIAAKIPKIVLITDGKYTKLSVDPIKMARLAHGLNITIDSFRLGDGNSSNILKKITDLTGGTYYYNNDPESLMRAAHELANSNIKTYGDSRSSIMENPIFLRKIAADLLRVQDLTKDQEQRLMQIRGLADYKKCSICFSDTNPYTKSSFYVSGRYCPNCQTPYHIDCLATWADSQKDNKMRRAGTVRCSHCFYLLKIPTEVTQARKLTSLVKPRIRENIEQKAPEISEALLTKYNELKEDDVFGSCPVCNFIFEEAQELVRCGNCKTLYHRSCFESLRNNRCKICGVKLHLY